MKDNNQQATEQALQNFCAKVEQATEEGQLIKVRSPFRNYNVRLVMDRLRAETGLLANVGEEDDIVNTLKSILGDLHDNAYSTAYNIGYHEGLKDGYQDGYQDGNFMIDYHSYEEGYADGRSEKSPHHTTQE